MREPVRFHNLGHQVLLHLFHPVSAQGQRPHLIERLGNASIVHIVGAPNDAWVDAGAFKAELDRLTLVLSLSVRPRAENVEASQLIIALWRSGVRLSGTHMDIICDHFDQSLV